MSNILFIHHTLQLGGGEKYIKELIDFALSEGHKPTIVIPNRIQKEYYDSYYENIGVKVIRFNILGLLESLKFFCTRQFFLNLYFRFFLKKRYHSVHFVNLGIASRYFDFFKHPNVKIWHVGNAVQYPDYKLPFNENIFLSKLVEIICVNRYQISELKTQFKISCKITLFKLFLND